MRAIEQLRERLSGEPQKWLITGAAGFIGSNLLEELLKLNQKVTGIDNFSTGNPDNLLQVRALVKPEQWSRFSFSCGDICDISVCQRACENVNYVLHQAALGSVPRSLANPLATHESNVTGFLNMLVAARDQKVKRFVFASSSSVYGDHPDLPKIEERIGRPLSPYAATKAMDEMYAAVFAASYRLQSIGLRYFNVFGPRQDPDGAYAAVIPRWIASVLNGTPVCINGDGETSRDFCYIDNVVEANLLAATAANPESANQVYNVAAGQRTTLNELFAMIQNGIRSRDPSLAIQRPVYRDFRAGDVRHSLADIAKARNLLGYAPQIDVRRGLEHAMDWYKAKLR